MQDTRGSARVLWETVQIQTIIALFIYLLKRDVLKNIYETFIYVVLKSVVVVYPDIRNFLTLTEI